MDYLPPEAFPSSATLTPHTDPRPFLASPTTPSTPGTIVELGPPPFPQNLWSNASTFDPRAGFQQTSSNGQSDHESRLPGFLRKIDTANGTSRGIGVDNIPPMPSPIDTSGIRPEVLSPGPLSHHSTRPLPIPVVRREAQFPVWRHLAGCSLSVDECSTCMAGYISLAKTTFSDHDEMEAVLCIGGDAQSFVDTMDKVFP